MRGHQVIVRGFDNKPEIGKIWDVEKGVVYVTSDRQYRLLLAGLDAPFPVGFPIEDVFEYSPEIAAELTRPPDWSQLKRWRAREE
ncbi:MAG: hypothetical protein MOB07_05685 [Acidobacteria bacterium]|nr:hypothetical protein [Acidobacteriota bacterium]